MIDYKVVSWHGGVRSRGTGTREYKRGAGQKVDEIMKWATNTSMGIGGEEPSQGRDRREEVDFSRF